MLFDDTERDYHSPALHGEDEFTFLNRSARPAAERVRHLLEDWAIGYPESEWSTLRARLRAEFGSVFFEMFLWHSLRALGCDVRAHPTLHHSAASRPDFLVRFPTGQEVVIEARVATDRSAQERNRDARTNTLFDEINKIESPSFFLRIGRVSHSNAVQPSGRKVRAFIERHLARLDPLEVTSTLEREGIEALPTWTFRDSGFELTVSVFPKSPPSRGGTGRAIGSYPSEYRWGGNTGAIRAAILRKVGKYGRVDRPFVIAVNALSSWGSDRPDVVDALFGSEQIVVSDDAAEPRTGRAPDGVWYARDGNRNRHLSAVLVCCVVPWNISTASIRLYHNPYAEHPCSNVGWRVPQAVWSEGTMTWVDGALPGALLGLEPGWPGELFDW
jgi:hypothetical protein